MRDVSTVFERRLTRVAIQKMPKRFFPPLCRQSESMLVRATERDTVSDHDGSFDIRKT